MSRATFAAVWLLSALLLASAGLAAARVPAQAAEPAASAAYPRLRLLTTEDVWRAIEIALWRQGSSFGKTLLPQDIHLGVSVRVPATNPEVVVREFAVDPLLHSIRFRLSVEALPKQPSFYVWCALPVARPGDDAPVVRRVSLPVAPAVRHDTLVSPRRPARLHLHSRDYSATLAVRPLEDGNAGETVRVRLPNNARTLPATVVGKDCLDASF